MKSIFVLALAAVAATMTTMTPANAATDPCSIISNAQASSYAGVAVTGKAYGHQCRYTARGQHVSVAVAQETGANAVAQFQAMKGQAKSVSGLGYPAFFVAGSVLILKGASVVTVTLIKNTGDMYTMDPQLPSLAKLVLSRI